ncbi:ankyrin repeat protein, partial [Cooperia oncophora]
QSFSATINNNVNEINFSRCYGSFFCADDQKASRTDSLEHEWVDLVQNTRYTGQMYWGELPLSFAACTNNQDDICSIKTIRFYETLPHRTVSDFLRAFRADPNKADTNGNTVLHLTVIHDLPEMFTLAYNSGASLSIRNNLKLTPLALAARLAKQTKRYPLVEIDSIREEDGGLNPCSVLANVVYGDKSSHLDFFDGLLEELLERKWEAFAKRR